VISGFRRGVMGRAVFWDFTLRKMRCMITIIAIFRCVTSQNREDLGLVL
jgi:hypothetical protein